MLLFFPERKRYKSLKKKKIQKKKMKKKQPSIAASLELHGDIQDLSAEMKHFAEFISSSEERLQDLEIHVNLLTRLLTTLCIEKFKMRVGVLKRLIKRIEKEAIRDSQIMQLESLYQMPSFPKKKTNPRSSSKNDPWEEIS